MSKAAEVFARLEAEGTEIIGPDGASSAVEPEEQEADALAEGAADAAGEVAAEGAGAKAEPEKKPGDAAAAKKPEEDRSAAKFAALTRQKQENLRLIEAAQAKSADIAQREARIAAKEAELEKALANPDEIFAALQSKFGIDSFEKLQKYAAKQWEKPKRAEDQPMTAAQVQELLAKQAEQHRLEASKREVENKFAAMTDDDEKYPAAALIFSRSKRVREGNRIATELTRLGEPWTFEDIADAVEELARQNGRYAKLEKRMGAQAKPAAGAKTDASTASQQGTQAKRMPTASDAAERSASTQSNGARQPRKERIAGILARMK